MQTRFYDFLRYSLSKLSKINDNNSNMPLCVQLESALSREIFENTLQCLIDDNIPQEEALNRLIAKLSARWQCITQSQASYFRSPASEINHFCFELAEYIAAIKDKAVLGLLMPGLRQVSLLKVNNEYGLHRYILGSKNQLIDVLHCIDEYQQQQVLLNTADDYTGVKLDADERDRVIFHSRESRDYYDAIRLEMGTVKINQCRLKLLELLSKGEPVLINEANQGKGYQEEALFIRMRSHINSLEKLLNLMCCHVPENQWHYFIRQFSDHTFPQLFNNQSRSTNNITSLAELKSCIKPKISRILRLLDNSAISAEAKEIKVAAFSLCLLQACYLIRKQGGDYYTYTGGILSWLNTPGIHSKHQKLQAIDSLMSFISSDYSLSRMRMFLYSEVMRPHLGILTSGELGWFVNQIEIISSKFHNEVAHTMPVSSQVK